MTHHKQHSHAASPILAFLTGAAVTAAVGGYLLFGPHGERNRRRVDRWTVRAKAEILDKMVRTQDVTEEQYHKIVDSVTDRYGRMEGIGKEKAKRASERFKNLWEDMREAAESARLEAELELEADERDVNEKAGK